MNTIATYLSQRNSDLTKYIQQYNDETNTTVIAMLNKQKTSDDQTTKVTHPVSVGVIQQAEPAKQTGPIEEAAKKMFEEMHPKVDEKKRKRREKLGQCVFMNRAGCACGKDATGLGENSKYNGQKLCTVHYNQCRQRCWYKV